MALRVFGLTGGIGSGKSAVAAHLRGRGLSVVDADELARVAVAPGSRGLAQIVTHFGENVLLVNGELDRAKLAARVFSNPAERSVLDRIVHPRVRELAAERFGQLAAREEPLACYEVPLLYEVGLEPIYRPVVVVDAPLALRKLRLAARSGFDLAQIEARIAAQMPLEAKVLRADYVIDNSGTLAELAARTDVAFEALCDALGVTRDRYPRVASADERV